MLAISAVPLLVGSLLVSAVLILLNKLKVGIVGSAAAVIALCLVLGLIENRNLNTGAAMIVAFRFWLIFLCVPSAVVFGISRSGLLRRRSWLLLLAGPVSFLITIMVVVNILGMLTPSLFRP
jgi:hypothetical protein